MVAPVVGYTAYAVYVGIGAALTALMEACASSEYACHDPANLPVKNQPNTDEFVSVTGQRKIIADKVFSQKAVDTFSANLIQREQQVEEFFDFQSPWRGKISLFLVNGKSPNNECGGSDAAKCSVFGVMIFAHPPEQLADLNESAEAGFAMEPIVHEMSHVLRFGLVNMPAGLEEGLAIYTEILLHRLRPNGGKPDHVAKKIFSGTMKPGDTIKLPEGLWGNTLTLMGTKSFDPFTLIFNYNQTNTKVFSYPVSIDTPTEIASDLIVRVTKNGTGYSVSLYQHSIFKDVFLDTTIDYQCLALGYRRIETTFTEDFEMTTVDGLQAYDKSAPYSDSRKYYPSNFCFWDSLRERAGHSAIQAIVQSMVTFSQAHVGEDSQFPFFQAVRAATGMSLDDAFAHFERFSAPTDNASYPTFNDICWK